MDKIQAKRRFMRTVSRDILNRTTIIDGKSYTDAELDRMIPCPEAEGQAETLDEAAPITDDHLRDAEKYLNFGKRYGVHNMKVKTIIIDSVSEANEFLREHFKNQETFAKPSIEMKKGADGVYRAEN